MMKRALLVCYVQVLVLYHVDKTGAGFVSDSPEVLVHFPRLSEN